jgi:hypothetical protein
MSNTLKVILAATIIIAIGVFGYWYATKNTASPAAPTGSLQSSNAQVAAQNSPLAPNDTAISDKLLTLLLNMRTIELNQSIFTDAAFTSLKDFSTTINPEPNPGRANPFAPIGADGAPTQPVITVTTGQVANVTKSTATFIGTLPIGSIVTKRYFEYGVTANPPLPNVTASVAADPATGGFGFNITGLLPNTTYYVRAAAVVAGGTIYGSVVSFKTPAN